MNKVSLILAILLVVALIAVPISYRMGQDSSATQLQTKFDNVLDEVRQDHSFALAEFEATLALLQSDWEQKLVAFQSTVRETLLNTGVTLEILNTEQEPDSEVDLVNILITQDTFETLKKGMSYEDVVELLGREGNNTMNMLDKDGRGLSGYVWKWTNDEGAEDSLSVTFEDQHLLSKHYSAFKL